ncbi:insulinase family protein [Candidatus Nomurabacteria bacterium]|nr:insulinase family protein [Candidatus Nomurabacteria bacterium]
MYKRIVRKDGSVVILMPQKETKAITFEVLYKVGSRNENDKNNGVSHFVEHLMFKGTEKRPDTATISRQLDGIGAEYNAFTGKDHTGYYIKADNSHLALAVEMLSDMLHNSKFDKAEIDRERGVIVEEINMYEDNPMMYIEEVFEGLLYQGTVLGREIAGPRENIRNISRSSLYNYYQKYYYSGNSVIGVAGNFKEAEVLKLLDLYFPVVKKQKRVENKKVVLKKQSTPQVKILKRQLEQVQLTIGFPSIAKNDQRFIVSQVLANILGGNMSSRLFLQIRERRGLCYFIRAGVDGFEDISSFSIHAGLNKEKIYEALEAIKVELNKAKNKEITEEELKQAKENIKGRLILRLEDSGSYLSLLSGQELLGKPLKNLEQILVDLNKITLKQVNDLASEIIDWSSSNLAIIGPFENKDKFIKVLKN